MGTRSKYTRKRIVALLCSIGALAAVWTLLARPDPGLPRMGAQRRIGMDLPSRAGSVPERACLHAPKNRGSVRFLVRDLADGRTVAGLALHAPRRQGATMRLRTGPDGIGRIADAASTDLARLVPSDAGWSGVWASASGATEHAASVFWVWRTVEVSGVVRPAPDAGSLDAALVAVEGRYGGPAPDGGRDGPAPWSETWLHVHGVPRRTPSVRPGANGSFSMQLPRIRGYGIRARADGWKTAWRILDVDSRTSEVAVDLVLRKAHRIRGVVRGPDGAPVAGADVVGYVVRRGRFRDFSLGHQYIELEDAFTGAWVESRDSARVTAGYKTRTDALGRFELELKTEGETWVIVRNRGMAPSEHRFERLDRAVTGIEPQLRTPVGPARCRLLDHGAPVGRQALLFSDMTLPDVQPAFRLHSDETGAVPTAWLETGREYVVVQLGGTDHESRRGRFVWTGQREIDFASLRPLLED